MQYSEIIQDLFTVDKSYALAHCISKDCKMGLGIAKEFTKRYRNMKYKLLEKNPQIGQAIVYYSAGRPIFNLITKEKYWHKPTYATFEESIISLKTQMIELKLKKIAIPQIGAGLDRLNWNKNREIIKNIFKDTDVEIVVCKLK